MAGASAGEIAQLGEEHTAIHVGSRLVGLALECAIIKPEHTLEAV